MECEDVTKPHPLLPLRLYTLIEIVGGANKT